MDFVSLCYMFWSQLLVGIFNGLDGSLMVMWVFVPSIFLNMFWWLLVGLSGFEFVYACFHVAYLLDRSSVDVGKILECHNCHSGFYHNPLWCRLLIRYWKIEFFGVCLLFVQSVSYFVCQEKFLTGFCLFLLSILLFRFDLWGYFYWW